MGWLTVYEGMISIFGICVFILFIRAFINRKKEHKKKKLRKHLRRLIIISAVVYLSTQMIYLNSLKEAVDFYYGEESSKVTVIKGEKSAVVFTPDTSEQSFFGCQNGKWKLPEYKLTRIVEKHQIDRNYYISTYHIGNEKGIYIIVTDQKPETSSGKKAVDSEGSEFIIPQKSRMQKVYCTYLKEIPKDYSLKIDGYEVDVDWNNLLNMKEYPIFV